MENMLNQQHNEKTLNDFLEDEIFNYKKSASEFSEHLQNYIKACLYIQEGDFSILRKDENFAELRKQFKLDNLPPKDPLFKANCNEAVAYVMNLHFSTNNLGSFSLKDELRGKEKIALVGDELKSYNFYTIEPLLENFVDILNQNVQEEMKDTANYKVWINGIRDLFLYCNSAIYLDTGLNCERLVPYNVSLLYISWLQNEFNIIDRVYHRRFFNYYTLKKTFSEEQINLIKYAMDTKTHEEFEHLTIELLFITAPNTLEEGKKKYTPHAVEKEFLQLIVCKNRRQKKDNNKKEPEFILITYNGFDKLPYLIARDNQENVLRNYGHPRILDVGSAGLLNGVLLDDQNDIALNKGQPPLFLNPSAVEGGRINTKRKGKNIAVIDDYKTVPESPFSILPTHEQNAISEIELVKQQNERVYNSVLMSEERIQIRRDAGQINNYVANLLYNDNIIKMSSLSASIEAEFKKPLLDFLVNYITISELDKLKEESGEIIDGLRRNLKENNEMGKLPEDYKKLYNFLEEKTTDAKLLKFQEKLYKILSNQEMDFFQIDQEGDEQKLDAIIKLGLFWDFLFDYDDEGKTKENMYSIKSIKNIELKIMPLREQVAMDNDFQFKYSKITQMLQLAQFDPLTSQGRVDIDALFETLAKNPELSKVIRSKQASEIVKQDIMQKQQAQQQQAMEQQALLQQQKESQNNQ
jgi:hypothetical protein